MKNFKSMKKIVDIFKHANYKYIILLAVDRSTCKNVFKALIQCLI